MKKLLSFAGVALLALIGVVGCDDDAVVTPVAPPPTPAPIFGTVSGTVSVEGSGLAGVIVNLSGAASQSASTGSSGGYSFDNVPAGTHSVQISGAPDEVTFGSIAAAVTITTSGQAATADFSGNYIRTSIIEGSVTAGGEGVVATVTASGAGRLMSEQANSGSSNADGDFELTGLRAGTYHVEISQFPEGIEFLVTMRDVTVGVGLSANASFDAPGEDGPTTDTGTGMSILITEVTDAGDDDGKYSGRVTATIDVERGEFAKIALYVDGAEVDAQLFGLGPAPAGEPPLAAQEGVIFSLSFNSAKYNTDIGPDLGKVAYPNGAHEIVAGVTVQGSTEEAYSNRMEVEFDNPDGVHALASLPGDPVFNSATGAGWYGGPDAGIVVGGTLVSYSGDVVGSLTLLDICGNKPITDSEAPFVFDDLECDETRVLTEEDDIFRIVERTVGILNGEGVFPLRLDYEGPEAPTFAANPNGREGGWINGDVDLTAKQVASGSKKNLDGWLVYDEMDAQNTSGVGGYTPQLRWATVKTTNLLVDAALAEDPSSAPALAATAKGDHICFIASAVDALGNESKLPKAETACASADPDDPMTEDVDESAASVIMAQVDLTVPTIDWTGASLDDLSRDLTERSYELRVTDEKDGSKIHSIPVIARVAVRNAKETVCGAGDLPGDEDLLGNCENTAEGIGSIIDSRVEVDLTGSKAVGYYTLTAQSQDKAGNKSEEISRVALLDTDKPVVSMSTTKGSNTKSEADYIVSATITDKLSIMDYAVAAAFGATYYQVKSSLVDAYNAPDPLTKSVPLDGEKITLPFLAVQEITVVDADRSIGAAVAASALRVVVSDQAGLTDEDDDDIAPAKATDGAYDDGSAGVGDAIGLTFTVTSTSKSDDSTLEFKAMVTAEDNPFDRVLFYATADDGATEGDVTDRRLIATVQEYSARESGGVWTYTARVSADDLYAAVGGEEDYAGGVYAVGVRTAGTIPGGRGSTSTATEYTSTGITESEDGDETSTTEVTSGDGLASITVVNAGVDPFGAAAGNASSAVTIGMRSGTATALTATEYEIEWDALDDDPLPSPIPNTRDGELRTRVNGIAGAAIDVDLTYAPEVNGVDETLTASYKDGDDTIEIAITGTTLTVTTKTPTGETEEIKVSGKPALVSVSTMTGVEER